PVPVKGSSKNIGCEAEGARELELAQCVVRLTTVARKGKRGRLLGVGERIGSGRSFKVRVKLNKAGRTLLRRNRQGLRATLVAEGTDTLGRKSTRRQRVVLRPAR